MIMTGAIKKEKKWRESIWKTWQKNRGWKEGMRAWRILLHLILYYYVLCFLVLSGLTLYGPVSLCPLYFELKPSYPILSYLFLRPISFHSITPNPILSYPILSLSSYPIHPVLSVPSHIRRERNREHAKKSRIRKRVLLDLLQDQLSGLRGENVKLRRYVRTYVRVIVCVCQTLSPFCIICCQTERVSECVPSVQSNFMFYGL